MRKAALLFLLLSSLIPCDLMAGDFGKLKKLIEKHDNDGLQRAIAAGADVNDQSGIMKESLLDLAVYNKDLSAVKVLVAAGALVNSANRFGSTPLHQAAVRNQKDIAVYLLDHEANINARDSSGDTPLITARFSPDVAILLLERGADYTAKNSSGATFGSLVEFYASTALPDDLKLAVEANRSRALPLIASIEQALKKKEGAGDPFLTLATDLADYFRSPEGRVLKVLSKAALDYILTEGSKYEPPAEPRLSEFSDWYKHSDGGQHREATLFCAKPHRLVLEIEERYSATGTHWFQRDVGATLLPSHHKTLADAIAIECTSGSGLIDHDRDQQDKKN